MKRHQGQPCLWDTIPQASDGAKPAALPPATANADPETSAVAEARVNASGRRERHVQILAGLVKVYPHETACELARRLSWQPGNTIDRHEASRRLADARRLGLVHNGPAKVCTVAGTSQLTWEPGAAPVTQTEA